ncbi:MAG: transporter substrate-binding domain-containing protein [Proteobacteria bacterium]|nr:transporter substrate-binding domain-containing protein [Pseudomonadota bacterium]
MNAPVTAALRAEIAPTGALRVALNRANFLLVTHATSGGDAAGIAADLGREMAAALGLPLQVVAYDSPGALADDAARGAWDLGFIGADPARAAAIAFSEPYVEIEATYLVPAGSSLRTLAEVDRPGVRIAVARATAYDHALQRTLQAATIVHADGLDGSFHLFAEQQLDALAGLRVRLEQDQARLPGSRLLDGCCAAIQQAAAVPRGRPAAAAWVAGFIAAAKAGRVAALIAAHGVRGLRVPPA